MSTDNTTQRAARTEAPEGVRLAAGDAEVIVRPDNGCRIAGLRVGGTELLRQGDHYGCFPMVPWCGRLDHGQFRSGVALGAGAHGGGELHQMPLNAAPHAIHGTGRNLRWRTARSSATEAVFTYELTDPAAPWPYPGRVTQLVELAEDGGSLTLTLGIETIDDSFPAQAGWHPWFLRNLGEGGEDVRLDFAPEWQEERGEDHLPTGRRIPPAPGPWDDCFGMPRGVEATLTWPGRLQLKISSRAEWVVVYDEQEAAVCVEPQSGPPNGLNTMPRLVTPIDPLEISMTWSWRSLSGETA
ncbi:aldose 1-epimerase [Streptomyces sioyaensis]|uniref:aldose epimerase family protein n=1 Tax=Streptomyces sioyaensis TaxID=67364 RepID=UPI001F375DBF|nr:aldose 1-epimerase [Streptomyces sioyaensis]MCF3172949.1 aldose 1-epimerase [Streptomyces sioyaensis]